MFPYKQTRSDCRPLSASLANASVFLTIFSLFFFSRHGASFFAFASLVGSVTASFNTEFELQQVWTLGLFPLLFVVSCLALFCLPSSGLICQLSYHLVSPDHRADVSSGLICQPSYHLVSPDHRADVSSGLICQPSYHLVSPDHRADVSSGLVLSMRCLETAMHHQTQSYDPIRCYWNTVERFRVWFGCVPFHDSLFKVILQGTLEGGRRRGRQRKCWMDNVKKWTPLATPELLTVVPCRKDWKRISAEYVSHVPPTIQSVKGLN